MTAGFNRQTLARLERAYGKLLAAQEDPTGLLGITQQLTALKSAIRNAEARPEAVDLTEVWRGVDVIERAVKALKTPAKPKDTEPES
jgi:hypothetical protein